MRRWKYAAVLCGCLLVSLFGSGCVAQSADELYALPRQPDAYYELQHAIDSVMPVGSTYAGPLSGNNQQAVQLADLDGDGVDEAVVFVKESGEKPLKVHIFAQREDAYENVATIEGDGSDFDSVDYVQLDGQPGMEILVGRRLSDQIQQSMGVYTYTDGRLVELMSANYSEYTVTDLDLDDRKDIFVLRLEAEERAGVAELYRYANGQLERGQQASLSVGVRQIKRIITGYVSAGVPAVFVASSYGEDTIVTDIFAMGNGSLRNISTSGDTGLSAQTIRNYNAYATDIDEDGLIELPMPVALPSATAGDETYWTIDWYNLSVTGDQVVKMTTYHNYAGSWYLVLPEHWHGEISVSRTSEVAGVRGYTFSKWNGRNRQPDEIFTIYVFTGDDRYELAEADGRFVLAEKGEVVYAASLGTCDWAGALTQEDLTGMFHFIHMDWNSGET